jgi:chemotaxis protein methyltransferase CheR
MDLLPAIRSLFRQYESLDLGGIRDGQLLRRVTNFARRARIDDEQQLLNRLRRDPILRGELIDALTINVTSLFRNAASWDLLWRRYLPELGQSVRMWSAGASTGAEAYSMAIIARENGQRARITATDIDRRSLDKAKLGRFAKHEMGEVPEQLRSKYFTQDGDHWVVDPDLRSDIRFQHHDLLAQPVVGNRFDLIACRNVVIYFSKDAQRDLHSRLAGALRPGGILFVGGAERVADPRGVGLEPLERMFYMRTATAKAIAV